MVGTQSCDRLDCVAGVCIVESDAGTMVYQKFFKPTHIPVPVSLWLTALLCSGCVQLSWLVPLPSFAKPVSKFKKVPLFKNNNCKDECNQVFQLPKIKACFEVASFASMKISCKSERFAKLYSRISSLQEKRHSVKAFLPWV